MSMWHNSPEALRTGHRVRALGGRHVGTVRSATLANGRTLDVTVVWDDTGWLTRLDVDEVEMIFNGEEK